MPAPVVIFVERYPVLSETFVINEAVALRGLGHEVSVEARNPPDNPLAQAPPGIPVHYATEEPEEERLRRLARLDRPHFHTHFATSMFEEADRIAALVGATTSLTAHAWDIFLHPSKSLPEWLARPCFVTSGSNYSVAHLRELAGEEAAGRIVKQTMGVDLAAFRRSTPLPGGRHVIGIGRLVAKKGFVHLVRAAELLPDVTVSIVGEGPMRDQLEREIDLLEVGDRVELLGALPAAAIRDLLESRADLLCMPCVIAPNGDVDSQPVVVWEAMAMELMVVASELVGLPDAVMPPWGAVTPPGDEVALARAIRDMLALGPEERPIVGALARDHVLEHGNVLTETRKLSGWIEGCRPAG